jgi:hypothetical protein
VAKKSTTKRPDGVTDRIQEEQQAYQGNVEKAQQPPGRVEVSQCLCFVVKKKDNAATAGALFKCSCKDRLSAIERSPQGIKEEQFLCVDFRGGHYS